LQNNHARFRGSLLIRIILIKKVLIYIIELHVAQAYNRFTIINPDDGVNDESNRTNSYSNEFIADSNK
jgi:hypothetical protein